MKNFLILILFTFISVQLHAQKKGAKASLTGKVTDAATKQPVYFATISIFQQGSSSPFNGGSTDINGNFKISNVAPGDYKVTVAFLGYTPKVIPHVIVGSDGKNVTLGNILLSPVHQQLKGVTVTAHAPAVENKIDKLVYNPANDLSAQGGEALDVLKKVPMVSVDLDGNVELMGNSNVQFLINGKPSTIFGSSLSDALQSIPASQIKDIEVITNPGAKYDASGTGGIINIVLKENKVEGVNGNVDLNVGTRLENGNFNFNAHKGKFGLNAYFGGRAHLNSTNLNSSDNTSTDSTGRTTRLLQQGSSGIKRSGYRSGLSLSWDISKKDQLTAGVGFDHFGFDNAGATNQDQRIFAPMTDALLNDTMSVNNSSSHFSANATDWNLAYKKTFDKKDQELDVLYDASYSRNNSNYSQILDYTNVDYPASGTMGNNPGSDKQTNLSVDYTQPISEGFTIETGAKAEIENLNNSVVTQMLDADGMFVPNPNQTYSFNYKRSIYAYYLSSSFSLFNDFIDGKAGLREEYTKTTSDFPNTNIPSYGILAPSFVLSHKLTKTQTVKFSYSYRLERPDYRSLNPFDNISDPHNISTGNPNLKPELGHNFEAAYSNSFNSGANIYVAAFYHYNTDDLQSFTTYYQNLTIGDTTYTNVYLNQNYNIGRQIMEGINLFGSVPITHRLTLRSNMFLANRILEDPGSARNSGFFFHINLNSSYDFGHDFAAEFFINYHSKRKTIQGNSPAFTFYNIAIRKQLMNKKLSIGLTAANAFNEYVDLRSNTHGANFNQSSLREIELRSFGLNISYRFGKLQFKKDQPNDNNQENIPDQGQNDGGDNGGGNGNGGGSHGGGNGGPKGG